MAQRVCLGKLKDGVNYGLEVSQPGVDVMSYTDDFYLNFSTRWAGTSSVHQSGMVGAAPPNSPAVISFPALSYVPVVIVGMYNDTTGYTYSNQSYWFNFNGTFYSFPAPNIQVTNDTLKISGTQFDYNAYPWFFKYYILRSGY